MLLFVFMSEYTLEFERGIFEKANTAVKLVCLEQISAYTANSEKSIVKIDSFLYFSVVANTIHSRGAKLQGRRLVNIHTRAHTHTTL